MGHCRTATVVCLGNTGLIGKTGTCVAFPFCQPRRATNCTIVAPLDECVCLHPHKVARLGEKENHNQTPKIQQPFLLQPHEQLYCVVARETLKQCFKKIIYIKKCISYLQGSVLARAAALQTMLSTTLLGQERPCTLPGTWALRAKGRGCYYFSSTLYCKGGCSTSHCPQ